MAGISNFTIEKVANEIDDDLKANFVGVFPSNHTFKFLRFADLIREKKAPYTFMIMNTDTSGKKAHIGGVSWKYLQKSKYCCLIAMVLLALKNLLLTIIVKLLTNSSIGWKK